MNDPQKINGTEYNPEFSDSGFWPNAELERAFGDAPVGASKAQEGDTRLFLIRVKSIRKRLLDEDNLSEKYHVDCCRYSGLISSDAPEKTKIEVSQRKAQKGEEEHTEIEIVYLKNE